MIIAWYSAGHYEKLPYNERDIRSIYHVREYDVHKLLQIEEPIDIFLSHDWPVGITDGGDLKALLRQKPFFEQEVILSGFTFSMADYTLLDKVQYTNLLILLENTTQQLLHLSPKQVGVGYLNLHFFISSYYIIVLNKIKVKNK